ncbi:GPW/gp25 family protein [Methylobacterium sp. 4-46]|uniref:GPW/gp25 family protein n=1 Tax=unclassified Methylobacterium TaxID=2615210 RepID=UPI000152DF51|nr:MULTISPECIES: GPW/gp25 family protein [Methylobacterium]ACA18493.1 GPW/gp25 family protein [Methylobacterium sp. 4-46]WFT77781.1 GPW/gp25 family protein [Methylobacterium nodulans]
MASCGLDRWTGEPSRDLAHVAQAVQTIFSTRLGERVMHRWFGGGLTELLGRRITPTLLSAYRMLLVLAISTWEPRLKVVRISATGNTVNAVELGQLKFSVICYYRPRGHLGDYTVEGGPRALDIYAVNGSLAVELPRVA